MILEGYVTDKNRKPVANAVVEIKEENFNTLFSTESDNNGYYIFDIPAGKYPFLIAVKDYQSNFLEYWCQDIPLQDNMVLNVSFDKLEIYGLHVFPVKGAGNSLMVYFRPMSLQKFQQRDKDIAPENITIKVVIDNQEMPIITNNLVKEFGGDREMTAYLIQVETTEINMVWHRLDLQIWDKYDNYGAATIFNADI